METIAVSTNPNEIPLNRMVSVSRYGLLPWRSSSCPPYAKRHTELANPDNTAPTMLQKAMMMNEFAMLLPQCLSCVRLVLLSWLISNVNVLTKIHQAICLPRLGNDDGVIIAKNPFHVTL